MSHAALTAKYRPQTFAQVAGQDTLKAILSRASLEGKIAPAYLFSGTRGVGKTTLARIFAKALNCRTAPTAEPCNQCDQCRAVTLGTAVDVVEIDGASNRGIDDVRRLKEVVGYAPMEGGYKIFIIDEAHMLSREAFNALLKTLEEPPAKVTFIMATTEPHKFPATIISRCQHYVFKRLPEKALADHLVNVLERENVEFEAGAVRLIARRGAGSVRDSMSLLSQVLALGAGRLTEESARGVLGLAGQEAFMRMIASFKTGDSLSLSMTLREMLDQGLDMGFFLRELSSLWRNMFILRQSGEAGLAAVELPENEARACLEACRDFSLQHIHACWQMTLEGQRRVLTSLEPALALELLLLNLAMLPRLLSLENLSTLSRRGGPPSSGGGSGQATPPQGSSDRSMSEKGHSSPDGMGAQNRMEQERTILPPVPADNETIDRNSPVMEPPGPARPAFIQEREEAPSGPLPEPVLAPTAVSLAVVQSAPAPGGNMPAEAFSSPEDALKRVSNDQAVSLTSSWADAWAETQMESPSDDHADVLPSAPEAVVLPLSRSDSVVSSSSGLESSASPPIAPEPAVPLLSAQEAAVSPAAEAEPAAPLLSASERITLSPSAALRKDQEWANVFSLCGDLALPPWLAPLLRRIQASWRADVLVLKVQDTFSAERLNDPPAREALHRLLTAWCGAVPVLDIQIVAPARKSREELQAELMQHPLVKEVQTQFGARIVDYGQILR